MNNLVLTPQNIYLSLAELIKAWLNIIIYERNIYPKESFNVNSTTSFGIVVPLNRHPDVIQWQDEFIENFLGVFLGQEANRIKQISLVIFDQLALETVPVERYVIDVSSIMIVGSDRLNVELEATNELNWQLVYDQMKSLIFNLLSVIRRSPPTLSKPSYDMYLETDQQYDIEKANNNNEWIADPQGIVDNLTLSTKKPLQVTSLAAVEVGLLNLYSHIERVKQAV